MYLTFYICCDGLLVIAACPYKVKKGTVGIKVCFNRGCLENECLAIASCLCKVAGSSLYQLINRYLARAYSLLLRRAPRFTQRCSF